MAHTRAGSSLRRVLAAVVTAGTVVGPVAFAPPAMAAPGDLVLVSTSDTGVKGNGQSFSTALSGDASTVAFISNATNLDPPEPSPTYFDVYVKNLASGDIALASTSDTGVGGDRGGYQPSLSADASVVAFTTDATNLDPGDTDPIPNFDIYVKDLASGDILLASTSDTGVKGNGASTGPVLSADGSLVAFESVATNLDAADTDTDTDVYVKDLTTGDIVLASDFAGTADRFSSVGSLSADGSAVAFTSLDLQRFRSDVYVKDLVSGDLVLAATSDDGLLADRDSRHPSLSGDGATVAFETAAGNLDPSDIGFDTDVYVKDLATGDVTLASVTDTGVQGNDESSSAAMAATGATVAFVSRSTNLDPADTDSAPAVFIKDLASGQIALASTSDAGVSGQGASGGPKLSADGATVAFESDADNLDPADTDVNSDVYVKTPAPSVAVSIGGGIRTEGDSGTRLIGFRVTLSAASAYPVTVAFATGGGTATAGVDYLSRSWSLTFAPGETRKVVGTLVIGDTIAEPAETFVVRISNLVGATIADKLVIGLIRNDD